MKLQTSILVAATAGLASSHSIFTYMDVEGDTYPASYAIRDPSYDGPIQDVTSQYIACNGGSSQPTTPSSDVVDVKAGDVVQAIWRHTLTSDSTDVIDASHKGPLMAYLKKVDDATTADGTGSGWFKIQEQGYDVSTSTWAVTDLIAAGGNQSITIPTCIEAGQYLLRAEILALHAASSEGGAQFYMECGQINIVGSTGAKTPATVSFPGAYSATDPGILINIYQTLTSYTIPGPSVFTC